MKGRRSTVRRVAAALSISLAMLVAAGAGAGAATTTALQNYTAQATSSTLRLSVQLPALAPLTGPLADVIQTDLSNIDEQISYANAIGQWNRQGSKILGKATSQVFYGTLDKLLATVLASGDVTKLAADVVELTKPNLPLVTAGRTILPVDLQIAKVDVGNQKVTALTALDSATTDAVTSLAQIVVPLAPMAASSAVGPTLSQLEDTVNGIVDQVNGLLGDVLEQADLPIDVPDLLIPKVSDLANSHILKIGLMESIAGTSVEKLGAALSNGATEFRMAHATDKLVGVSILDGLIKADVIELSADAKLDNLGGNGKADAVTKILGLKVGDLNVDLTTGSINIAGQEIALPTELKDLLNSLVVDVAGVKIEALHNTEEVSAGHAFAAANSLRISVAPTVGGQTLFALNLQGPMSQAGVDLGAAPVKGPQVLGKQLRRTGLSDTTYFLVGPMLFAVAVLVRRFALSK